MQLFCFGDSITLGKSYGWVKKLEEYLEETDSRREMPTLVYNLGIAGEDSRRLLERFEKELDVRDSDEAKKIAIFQIGINDAQFIKKKNATRIQKEEFKQNLEDIWYRANQKVDNIIFIGITPVVESKTDPVEWDNNKAFRTKNVREYEDKLFEFCQEKDVIFVELYDQFLENGYGNLLRDGIHPNEKGHELIFQRVKQCLKMEELT